MLHGGTLRVKRLDMNLSQAGLAELTGLIQARISGFELGKIILTDDELSDIERVLNDVNLVQKHTSRGKRFVSKRSENGSSTRVSDRNYCKTVRNAEYVDNLTQLWKKHSTSDKRHSCISLFSGCGGFSLGASAAGFSVLGHVELEKTAREIYSLNLKNSECLGQDIQKVEIPDIKEKYIDQNIDVIIGGPPCQGFSLSGKRDSNDPRNRLFLNYLDILQTIKPKFAILENVEKLLSMKDPENNFMQNEIVSKFKETGYVVEFFRINAANYGVPQNRKRVLFIAVREDLNRSPSIPAIEFSSKKSSDLFVDIDVPYTLGDAVSDLPFIESGEQSDISLHRAVNHPEHVIEWLWNVPQGHSAHDNEDENLRPPSGYNTTYKRQVWDEPSATVQTTSGMISGSNNVHPIATRSLSIRETARLQSFPDQFAFSGNNGAIRTAIGNAVPPMLAFKILNHLKNQIL